MEISFANLALAEILYEEYKMDPQKVDPSWRQFFQIIEREGREREEIRPGAHPRLVEPSFPEGVFYPITPISSQDDLRVLNLIQAYRAFGHLMANIDPIAIYPPKEPSQLNLESLGFQENDLSKEFSTYGLLSEPKAPLKKIIETLKEIYCNKIGVEYVGFQNFELEKWLQQQIEPTRFKPNLSIDQKKMILQQLNKSELLESFIHTKYVGQKRFSLEGGETLIPMLEEIIDVGSELNFEEIVLGMAHRGRLNVLSNILKKSYADIFSEFEESYIPESFEGSGDVKYHKGYTSEVSATNGSKIKITLTPNPSHLESVCPVVEGQTRAKQDRYPPDNSAKKIIPVIIHGDAALTGQGIVYETMQFEYLEGYETGGTIHLVINNQIGFTTLPKDARSTLYCTDIAKAFGAPIFHVNAEDPEGCVYVTSLAVKLRQKFHCDVFIDINCYRKYGHNETDEPAFTQPLEYQIIRKKKPIRELYRDLLIHEGVLEKKIVEDLEKEFKSDLQKALAISKKEIVEPSTKQKEQITPPESLKFDLFAPFDTGVDIQTLREIAGRFSQIPENFNLHPKLANLVKERLSMLQENGKKIDWGMAETLAYGSLLWEGISIRLSGQDVCRGTFSHRHALWMDQKEEKAYFPLKHLKDGQGQFDIFNSPLSEFGVLGFEYGYSIANLDSLEIWEAQFGDFANGAQIVIDQYISTGEQKWGQRSGLTLFLPHGYEGQGPEHSSARIERFLSLCGENNMIIANPTTPAQLFHLLRRQVLWPIRKPLVIFTPKGLLRHPACTNNWRDLTQGCFQEILDDPKSPKKVKRLLFCSGRIFYDLDEAREKTKALDLGIVRIEQLFPLHTKKLSFLISKYAGFQECSWVQEEPKNMGAWNFIYHFLQNLLPENIALHYIGREQSASTATGSHAKHKQDYEAIMNQIFRKT